MRAKDDRVLHITSSKYNAHQANTADKREAVISAHKVNLTKSIGRRLTLLHTTLVQTSVSEKRMEVVKKYPERTSQNKKCYH